MALSGVAGPAAGTQGRDDEVLYLCTESPEEWASHLSGEALPEGGVIGDEVEGVNRATECRGDVPARENTTWSQTANNSLWLKM